MDAMFFRRVEPWLEIIGLAACTERERAPQPIDAPSPDSITGMTGEL
jgi:hypothetical protein